VNHGPPPSYPRLPHLTCPQFCHLPCRTLLPPSSAAPSSLQVTAIARSIAIAHADPRLVPASASPQPAILRCPPIRGFSGCSASHPPDRNLVCPFRHPGRAPPLPSLWIPLFPPLRSYRSLAFCVSWILLCQWSVLHPPKVFRFAPSESFSRFLHSHWSVSCPFTFFSPTHRSLPHGLSLLRVHQPLCLPGQPHC
jgi:hypothetical protein